MRASATWVAPSSPSYGEPARGQRGGRMRYANGGHGEGARPSRAPALVGANGSGQSPKQTGREATQVGSSDAAIVECPLDGLEIEPAGTRVVARLRRSCRLGGHGCVASRWTGGGVSYQGRRGLAPCSAPPVRGLQRRAAISPRGCRGRGTRVADGWRERDRRQCVRGSVPAVSSPARGRRRWRLGRDRRRGDGP
jgi:hypothetical protein